MEKDEAKLVLSGSYEGSYRKFRNFETPKKKKNNSNFIKLLLKKIKK